MDYVKISKKTMQQIYAAYSSLSDSPLSEHLRTLVMIRASQMNGCSYCCALHAEEARASGIAQEMLDALPVWRDSKLFSQEERLVLDWCESVTLIKPEQSGAIQRLLEHFSEREFVDLHLSISLVNALNRVAIYLRND